MTVGDELASVEELTGSHKLWDLEGCRSLTEKVQEACRKARGGNVWEDC